MQITIQATNSADLRAQIFALAKLVGFDERAEIQGEFNYPPTVTATASPGAVVQVETTEKPARGRGRPKKEDVSEIHVSDLAKSYVKGDVDTALKEVMDKKGIPAVREVLSRSGYNRVSDIPADRYGEFIEQCKEAVND